MSCIFGRLQYKNSQKGFTLIELLIAIGISSFVMAGVVTTLYQFQSISNSHFVHIVAVDQVENAVHYINRDAQGAQGVTTGAAWGFPLSLTWVSWDTGDTNTVTYLLQQDSPLSTYKLMRKFQLNQNTPTTTTVARYIVYSANTYCGYNSPNHTLTIQLTATVTKGNRQDTETRKLPIVPRSGS